MDVVELTDNRKAKLGECPGQELCTGCFWWVKNGGQCSGCDDGYQQRCFRQVCYYNCNRCSGGKKARTPGACGYVAVSLSSWRDDFKRILEYPVADYAPAPLDIQCPLIPVLYPEVKKFGIPGLKEFSDIDAWAVPIHKVAGLKGRFFSDDLKEYLGIPADKKLILVTCASDDYQEMLWEEGPEMRYEDHGIDYWFPGHFSVYDNDSKLYQFISAKRQQIHATWTESQFVWFRLGENIPIEFLNPVRKAPSVLISTNQMYSKQNKAILAKEVAVADEWFSPETSFFVVGTPKLLGLSDKHKCYEINTNWLMRSLRGRDLKGKKSTLTKDELFIHNLNEVLENVS